MAQLIPVIDNTVLFIIVVLIIIILAAALLLKKAREEGSEKAGLAQMQRIDYQPSAKTIPKTMPIPVSTLVRNQQPAPAIATYPGKDFVENCQNFQQCILAVAEKYSLDSFTIATSDGLVFASSGGGTAQEDAASYSTGSDVLEPAGMTLFRMNHRGSDLTGIIRAQGIITEETQKRIEIDTKDILNRWI